MKFSTDVFLGAIAAKKVYYFSSTKLNTPIPHHFVCVKRTDNEVLILTCCTSQFDTVSRFVESRNLPNSTLVWISPKDPANPFITDTYVNCNNSFSYTVDEFRAMYESDSVNFSGEIAEPHYVQILTGIHSSPMIDAETKELIPHPDSL